jgi:hypothetical protein
MRSLLACLIVAVASVAAAAPPVVVVTGAQDHAVVLARRGALVHSGCGRYEGIGFSTAGPLQAKKNCCYWGRRTPVDIGVAYSPLRRGWFAVVRYQ